MEKIKEVGGVQFVSLFLAGHLTSVGGGAGGGAVASGGRYLNVFACACMAVRACSAIPTLADTPRASEDGPGETRAAPWPKSRCASQIYLSS